MFASIVWDALAGLGCMTFTVMMMAAACVGVALWMGYLPGLADIFKRLGRGKSDG
jgi:hypothetical protein